MHDHNPANGYSSREGIAHLSHSFETTLDQNRALFTEMARFAKDESLRIAHKHLEHADHAFSHLHDGRNFTSLIGAQQEWIRDMMQEYAAQSLRYAELFQTMTRNVQSRVESAASDLQEQVAEEAEILNRQAGEMLDARAAMNGGHVQSPAE
jgi:hypothetical protein